jgi:TPR repeat protein
MVQGPQIALILSLTMKSLILALSLLLTGSAWANDLSDGVNAYLQGNYAVALPRLRTVAENGNVDAQLILAEMYKTGKGVTQDHAESVRWLRLAAKGGSATAQYRIGNMYYNGQGVVQDLGESARWYRLAASGGEESGQFALALLYEHGIGVLQDYVRAYMWYNISSVSGSEISANMRARVAVKMTTQQIAEAQRLARECVNSNYKSCD